MASKGTEKELKRLTAIIELHHSIGANLELEQICRISVRELADALGCDGCAIMLIEGDEVKIMAEKGFAQTFGEMTFSVDMPAIRHILNTKEDIFTGDVTNSPAASCVPHGCAMNSLICAPIMVDDEVKGIIHLDSSEKNAFDRADLEFAQLLAKEISIAMERSFLYSEVRDSSISDGLTGCFNRRKFDVDIAVEIATAKRYKKPLSFFMVDVDWFKKYNDFHGHPKGDAVLNKLVNVLTCHVRSSDKIYRYGGEEFAILLPDTNKEEASLIAIRVQEAIGQEQFEGEKESQPDGKVTVSIGVATFPVDADNKDGLITAADSALYKAKQSGRNRVCAF
ncbi:MAG: sensor domain-containing diguanylate cyclase [Chloroflexi bacterium]|nr:sensor domain-containing diguanylate cyclase [Chloroflexota bacterium]